ncbi:AmmeMemoRadiSam system protein A [bacterium]|nr:MAG: AmmeMemoRadiSam system protein A [bacterium]
MNLSAEEKKLLLDIARQSIVSSVKGVPVPDLAASYTISPSLEIKAGAFVTIEIDQHLRGCVGYIQSNEPLAETVSKAAVSAALHDNRFSPLTVGELGNIEIEISVLSPMKKVKDVESILPGQHGLLIESGFHHGLLLPQVATEYRWDRETFLEQTCIKAGLPKNAWKKPETVIYCFTALVFNEEGIN